MKIRRLAAGDEHVVEALATREPSGTEGALLADERTIFLVAIEDGDLIGFVLAHELPRRHAPRSKLFVYEVEVDEAHRRRGVGTALLAELSRIARERGIPSGFVLTERTNAAAMALYRVAGAQNAHDVVEWTFVFS